MARIKFRLRFFVAMSFHRTQHTNRARAATYLEQTWSAFIENCVLHPNALENFIIASRWAKINLSIEQLNIVKCEKQKIN